MNINFRQTTCVVCVLLFSVGEQLHAESPIRPGEHVAIVGNTFADQLRMHGYLETLLLHRWPDNPVSIRNFGWGGDMLTARDRPTNFPTEESTLKAHQTDVIVACFGMGESFSGEAGVDAFRNDLKAFISSHTGKSYNGKANVRLILVSPIAQEDLGELTPARERRNNELALYSQSMGEVAAKANVPFVDLYQPVRYLMDEALGPDFTTNGIHLNAYGYWAVSHLLYRDLVADEQDTETRPWQITIDVNEERVTARGVKTHDATVAGDELKFKVTEQTSPTLPPPSGDRLPHQLSVQRDTMTVNNLPPGNYALKVDGKTVVTADHKRWATGVAVDSSPAHAEAEVFRKAVNDKNLQFTYSWKMLNQVHIVGERKTSPSGRALPAEVIEFKELADQRDKKLRQEVGRKTRQWSMHRVEPR